MAELDACGGGASGLRDKLIIDVLQGIGQAVRAIADAVVCQATATTKLTEALQLDRRVTTLEAHDTDQINAMARHRDEHRLMERAVVGVLISIIIYLGKLTFLP